MRFSKLIPSLFIVVFAGACGSEDSSNEFVPTSGQGGSMTRFAISGNTLYVVDHSAIQVFNIGDNNFSLVKREEISFGMETIFVKGPHLYLGANDGMYIYSIADPLDPKFVFRYEHIVSCDPVVVVGNRAYVTMRSGTSCNRGINALEILDISNPYAPVLLQNYPIYSPHGLGVLNNILFLCEGELGFKVYDVSNPHDIVLRANIENIFAYDVIVRPGNAIITGEDGIFQYEFAEDGSSITLRSAIAVNRTER